MNNPTTELTLECNIILIKEIRKAIPPHLFKKNEARFLVSVAQSLSCTIILVYLGYNFIPMSWYALPIWIVFDLLLGTVAMGICIKNTKIGVLGHECGHKAFSDIGWLNDVLGFIFHELLLVPYFTWQHSHSVHHAKTSHLTEGETHCPVVLGTKTGNIY